jgi:hypothetical protein
MDTGSVLGGIGVFLSIAGIVYSAINHKHIRSKCCGREIDFSIDIESTDQANTGNTKNQEEKLEVRDDKKEKKEKKDKKKKEEDSDESSDESKDKKKIHKVHDGEIPMFKFRPLKVMPHFDV